LTRAPPGPPPHQAAPREQVGGRTRRRPVLDLGMAPAQRLEQLARTPVLVQPAELAEPLGEDRADLRRAGVRSSAAIGEPALAVLVEPGQPLVADAAADAVTRTELGHGEAVAEGVGHELQSLIHGITLRPRHHSPHWLGCCDAA